MNSDPSPPQLVCPLNQVYLSIATKVQTFILQNIWGSIESGFHDLPLFFFIHFKYTSVYMWIPNSLPPPSSPLETVKFYLCFKKANICRSGSNS